jgi:hypothetical protein
VVQLAMVLSAKGYGEFVAGLQSETSRLSVSEVVWIGRPLRASNARLKGHEPEVLLVANAARLRMSEDALVDGAHRSRG